ncbi:MAG: sigma-54-dependent Fis family transcriptional regulator, partial [Gammaproteobacteria bacterium]|nr:sigma-54-dependent Fis family transcriptional regulator [Gammaproteobacteria bacterium]
MSSAHSVLIIDDNEKRQHDFMTILGFIGEPLLSAGTDNWQVVVEEAQQAGNALQCVFVGEVSREGNVHELVTQLTEGYNASAIITLGNHGHDFTDGSNRQVIAQFDWLPSYSQLTDTLHRAQVFAKQRQRRDGRIERRGAELFRSLVGTSRGIAAVRELMAQVADKDVNVLIT